MATEKRLIDVNKVINSMQQCLDENPDDKGLIAYTAFQLIIGCLKQEPTVDAVEVVHARWIWNEEYECWVCSNCECSALNNYRGNSVDSEFCPNCGAKMDGERITNERKAN